MCDRRPQARKVPGAATGQASHSSNRVIHLRHLAVLPRILGLLGNSREPEQQCFSFGCKYLRALLTTGGRTNTGGAPAKVQTPKAIGTGH